MWGNERQISDEEFAKSTHHIDLALAELDRYCRELANLEQQIAEAKEQTEYAIITFAFKIRKNAIEARKAEFMKRRSKTTLHQLQNIYSELCILTKRFELLIARAKKIEITTGGA